LRIAPESADGSSLTLSVSDGPHAGDEVIEAEGVRVFVQADAAAVLGDKALDAEVDEQGVTFRLGIQPD
jgi:Fe-S cluster assembly iron-binding protein IscA